MCEPEAAVPVIVRVEVLAAVFDEVVNVRVDDPPEVTDVGENVAVTPDGTPVTERATLWDEPLRVVVFTVTFVVAPATTLPDDGLAEIEKSFTEFWPVSIGPEIAQALVALDQVDCMAKEPVANETFCAPPGVPGVNHAHLSPFSIPVALS